MHPEAVRVKVKGVAALLKQLGFNSAAKDVTTDNYTRYATWVLGAIKDRIVLIDPETRKRTVDDHAQHVYNQTLAAFKAMKLVESRRLREALDVGQAGESESCANGMKEAGEQLKAAREAVFKLTTSTLVQCASMAQATGAKRTIKELEKAQALAATFLDDLKALAMQVDKANEVMKGENGGVGGDNLDAMKQAAAAPAPGAPAATPVTPPATPAAPAPASAAAPTAPAAPAAMESIETADEAVAALLDTPIAERIANGEGYRSLNESISSYMPHLGVRERVEAIDRIKAMTSVPLDASMRVQFNKVDHRLLSEAVPYGSLAGVLVSRTRGGAGTLASVGELRHAISALRRHGKSAHTMLAATLEAAMTGQNSRT